MQDDKKKKYDPFPDAALEGEAMLDDDEETPKPPSQTSMSEEEREIVTQEAQQAEDIAEEEDQEEADELAEERTMTPPAKQVRPGPRQFTSWFYPALGAVAVMIAIDYGTMQLGRLFFWNITMAYLLSFLFRMGGLALVYFTVFRPRMQADRATWYAVCGWIGFSSGLILGSVRYIVSPTFWTFLNVIVEPADMTLLSLGVTYLALLAPLKINMPKQTATI